MSLREPGQGKIFLGQFRQCRPADPGLAAAGQRQVQPSRLHRLGEGGRGRGARPVAGAVITHWRIHDGQRLSSSGHFHPLDDPSLLPAVR